MKEAPTIQLGSLETKWKAICANLWTKIRLDKEPPSGTKKCGAHSWAMLCHLQSAARYSLCSLVKLNHNGFAYQDHKQTSGCIQHSRCRGDSTAADHRRWIPIIGQVFRSRSYRWTGFPSSWFGNCHPTTARSSAATCQKGGQLGSK